MNFKEALDKICNQFNKEIIFERRVISILDDYGAFNEAPYYKLFYRTVLSSGNLRNLVSDNQNDRDKNLFSLLSVTGLDETKLKAFLSVIFECYYGYPSISITTDIHNDKAPKIQYQNDDNKDTNNQTNYEASFVGIKFGIDIKDFCDQLKLKKIGNNFSQRGEIGLIRDDIRSKMIEMNLHDLAYSDDVKIKNVRIYRFPFAGFNGHKGYNYFEGSEIAVFYTPYSRIVYKVMVYLIPSEHMFDEEICNKVKRMLFDRYGKPTKDDIKGSKIFDKPNDKSCDYVLNADFVIKYGIWQRGAQSGGVSFKHYLTYFSPSLCKIANKEIEQKINEIILEDEIKKNNQYSKDVQDL